ncbi:MAG: hypothetical protein WCE82_10880 [Halobacteriota archaeon]
MVTSTSSDFSQLPVLQEIYQGTIRAHHAKAGYDYPTIRLPFTFSGLIGLPTCIYQSVHEGALAFLVVISSGSRRGRDNSVSNADQRLHTAEVGSSNLPGPILFYQSDAVMMADDEEEKLPTSKKLPTSEGGEETRQKENPKQSSSIMAAGLSFITDCPTGVSM